MISDRSDSLRAFRLGDWLVEPDRNRLVRGDREATLEPKIMDLLVHLAQRPGRTHSRRELLDEVWEGKAVVDAVLTRAISEIRQALGDDPREPRYVETVPRKGYRLLVPVGSVAELLPPSGATPVAGESRPEVAGDPPAPRDGGPLADPARAARSPGTPGLAGRSGPGRRVLAALVVGLLLGSLAVLLVQRTVPAAPEGPIRSLAVLPFEDFGGGESGRTFALGLTDAVITELSRLRGLRVISRTSVMAHEASSRPLAAIAGELDVEAVLEGAVAVEGDAVRIRVRLVDARRDETVWSEELARPLRDVLDLQAEVARAVAREIDLTLSRTDRARLSTRRAIDPEAYREHLLGRWHLDRRTTESIREAVARFEAAIAIDPAWAPARSGLADALVLSAVYYLERPEDVFGRAREAAEKAVALDPTLPEGHASLGLVRLDADWDLEGALDALRRAIALGPGALGARQWEAEVLSMLGRHDDATRAIEEAIRQDPLSPVLHASWGQRLSHAGRWADALVRLRQAQALGARMPWIHREMAIALERLGHREAALAERVEEMTARGESPEALGALERALDAGVIGFWGWQVERLERRQREGRFVPAALFAEARGGLGDLAGAREALEKARSEPAEILLLLAHSPGFDPLRDAGHPWLQAPIVGSGGREPADSGPRPAGATSLGSAAPQGADQAAVSPDSKPSAKRATGPVESGEASSSSR